MSDARNKAQTRDRVLIISDDNEIRDEFCSQLDYPSVETVAVPDVRSAAAAMAERVDVLIIDLATKGGGCADVLVAAENKYPRPVVVALCDPGEREFCQRVGYLIHEFVLKPVEVFEVRKAIAKGFRASDIIPQRFAREAIERGMTADEAIRVVEFERVQKAMEQTGCNEVEAAKLLGVSVERLQDLVARLSVVH